MSGLFLKLAPRERILVNGVVIENGDKRSRLSIKSPNAHVLRLKDAIHPDRVNTPVSRACYIAQLVLSGDADPVEGQRQLLVAIEGLSQVFDDRDSRQILNDTTDQVTSGNVYQAMRRLRELLPREARMQAMYPQ